MFCSSTNVMMIARLFLFVLVSFGTSSGEEDTTTTTMIANPMECINASSLDSEMDYFPVKVEPIDSAHWKIQYFNTYKILTNTYSSRTFLLYQCGTEPPTSTSDDIEYDEAIEIPIKRVGITQTPFITYLEQLGLLERIEYFISNPGTISSPCFNDRVDDGHVIVLQNTTLQDEYLLDNDQTALIDDVVVFRGDYEKTSFKYNIDMSEYAEKTNSAIFGWIKVFSAFFNLEHIANEVVEAANDRFRCVKNEAELTVTADAAKPKVLWASYDSYCGGWDLAKCDEGNYYCEFAETCSTDMLWSYDGSIRGEDFCDKPFMTLEEFVDFGKDADYWFYPRFNWDDIYGNANNTALLDTMKSVQNEHVYDILGSDGGNAWFEQRYAEYYDVCQDFCSVAGTTVPLVGNGWFRNVFHNDAGVSTATCEDERGPLLPYELQCPIVEPDDMNEDDVEDVGSSDNGDNDNDESSTTTGTSSSDNNNSSSSYASSFSLSFFIITTLSSFLYLGFCC